MKKRTAKLTRIIAGATVILGITLSCQTDEDVQMHTQEELQNPSTQMTVLGEEQGIVYSIDNMKQALHNYLEGNSSRIADELNIRTTHLYVKFAPRNESELELLTDDTTQLFFDIPLHYEIAIPGSSYHDPSLPSDVPTYQYATLPVDYDFPDLPYEILEELYIPEEDEQLTSNGRTVEQDWIYDLVDEAEKLAGIVEEDSDNENGRVAASRWTSHGYVRVYNYTTSSYEPVQGLQVIARRNLRSISGVTNADGYFRCEGARFKNSAKYIIKWDKYEFSIRDNGGGEAKWESGNTKSMLDAKFGNASDPHATQRFFGIIFKAAYH